MDSCFGEAEIAAHGRGELAGEARERLEKHLQTCAECYARMLRGDKPDTNEGNTAGVDTSWVKEAIDELQWQPGLDLGRYVILLTLGQGGMGVVYRAYDKELDRAVALKVLHAHEESPDSAAQARLLREAQAMARLSHPNVVGVHDVVILQKRVCVVMELVEGVNVREWLRAQPRPWQEILAVFRAAGEGLAAAHDARLVHRDFKPDNVLVGQDGRARVTDFGIARLATEKPAAESGAPQGRPEDAAIAGAALPGAPVHAFAPTPPAQPASDTPVTAAVMTAGPRGGTQFSESITRDGQLVGTPRYMAPEQFDQKPADFRTDQFSFAVALYEALYGQHAYEGSRAADWLARARRNEIRPPPSNRPVPQWLHRILVRALSAEPAHRFASMRELTQALGRDPSQLRNRRLLGAGVGAAVTLALIAVAQGFRARAELCSGAEERLAGAWDEARRSGMRSAFAATGLPFAEDSLQRAEGVLDAYTREWVDVHQEACRATRVRGEQSDQMLTLRMACLEQRLNAVSSLTELFGRADSATVGKAKQLLDELPRLSTCSDAAALTASLPPPEDPAVAAEVERIRKDVTRVRMLTLAGRVDEAEAAGKAALEAAGKTPYTPVQAEAEVALGGVLSAREAHEPSKALYTAGFKKALADGHQAILAFAAVRIAAMNVRLRLERDALDWADYAEAANVRARDPETTVLASNVRGNTARNLGEFSQAADHYRKAMEAALELLGAEHMSTLGTSYNYASTLQNLGRYREAKGRYAAVVEGAERALGPRHPFLAFPLVGSGIVATHSNEPEKARQFYEKVLLVTGGKGPNAANAHEGLLGLARREKRYEDALHHAREALKVTEANKRGSVESLGILAEEGDVWRAMGRTEDAWKRFAEVIERSEKLTGTFDAVATAARGQAEILLARGQPQKALARAEVAVATLIPKRGESHPDTLQSRLVAAEAKWAAGKRAEAAEDAARVLDEARRELPEEHPVCVAAAELSARAGVANAGVKP